MKKSNIVQNIGLSSAFVVEKVLLELSVSNDFGRNFGRFHSVEIIKVGGDVLL